MTAVFPDSRLRRARATFAEVKAAGEHWSGLDESARADLAAQIAGMSNRDVKALVEDLAAAPGTIYQAPADDDDEHEDFADALATVDAAKAHADAHPDQVEALLAAEQAGKDRTTLVAHLQGLLDDADDDASDEG